MAIVGGMWAPCVPELAGWNMGNSRCIGWPSLVAWSELAGKRVEVGVGDQLPVGAIPDEDRQARSGSRGVRPAIRRADHVGVVARDQQVVRLRRGQITDGELDDVGRALYEVGLVGAAAVGALER